MNNLTPIEIVRLSSRFSALVPPEKLEQALYDSMPGASKREIKAAIVANIGKFGLSEIRKEKPHE